MTTLQFLIKAIALICMWGTVIYLQKGWGWALFVTVIIIADLHVTVGAK